MIIAVEIKNFKTGKVMVLVLSRIMRKLICRL